MRQKSDRSYNRRTLGRPHMLRLLVKFWAIFRLIIGYFLAIYEGVRIAGLFSVLPLTRQKHQRR